MKIPRQLDGFLFDLDGSLYLGNELLTGASELLDFLDREGKKIAFITNNSFMSDVQIADKLLYLGIHAESKQIITPAKFAGEYIKEKYGLCRIFVIGSDFLKEKIKGSGHELCFNADSPCDVVLIGRDLSFDYRKLEAGALLIQKGARFIAANLDGHHPIENGMNVPETGALTASLEKVVGIHPEVIGKPSSYLFNKALEIIDCRADATAIIGDNPETDILGGKSLGLYTIWLRYSSYWLHHEIEADIICKTLTELLIRLNPPLIR